jgi:hypothetical protein
MIVHDTEVEHCSDCIEESSQEQRRLLELHRWVVAAPARITYVRTASAAWVLCGHRIIVMGPGRSYRWQRTLA